MKVRHLRFLQISVITVVMLLGFNNCSPPPVGTEQSSSTQDAKGSKGNSLVLSSTGDVCEDAIRETFVGGYYKFVRNNCTVCHEHDADKPQFASTDPNWAYDTFMSKGYDKVSARAISELHQPPYTGTKNVTEISALKLEWQKGMSDYNNCKGAAILVDIIDPVSLLTLQVTNKPIPALAVDQSVKLTWNLNTDIYNLKAGVTPPKFAGASLSVVVTRRVTGGGEDYYTIKAPTIFGASVDIKVKTIYAKINNRILKYGSTFKYVNTAIRKNSKEDLSGLITTGALSAPGVISASDTLTLAFETLESTVLPDPLPPVIANFTNPKYTIINSSSGTVDVTVGIVDHVDPAVIVTVEEDGTLPTGCTAVDGVYAIGSGSCLADAAGALSAAGMTGGAQANVMRARSIFGGSYNRFDWDYQYGVNAIQMKGTNPSEIFKVKFSKDIRKEATNRILKLKLIAGSADVVAGSNSEIYFIIRKVDNPTPALGEWTFSKLMGSHGILNDNCVRCHNSNISQGGFQGGYDMTDYDSMINKQPVPVLVPFSTASRMYRRLNSADPDFNDSPMPKEGAPLTDLQIQAVEAWILGGAKNN